MDRPSWLASWLPRWPDPDAEHDPGDRVFFTTFNVPEPTLITIYHTGEAMISVNGTLIYEPPPRPTRRRRMLNRLRSMRGWPEGKAFTG